MAVRRLRLALVLITGLWASSAMALDQGLVTVRSTHSVRATLDRFEAAVRAAGWVVFTEIDHAAAARAVGMDLLPRMVVIFGNPQAGTPAMRAHPTLALDLPMRALVWQDDAGAVFITRSSGADLGTRVYARHGIDMPDAALRTNEAFFADLAKQAAE